MREIITNAIDAVNSSELSFCRFITANDAGTTGGHQAGFYIPKSSWSLFLDKPGERGENKDKYLTIKWQDDFETDSRFIYYGQGSRNEYRLTRFGRGFPFLGPDNVGDLLVITRVSDDYFRAFVLSADEDIEDFLAAFGLSATDAGNLITGAGRFEIESNLDDLFKNFLDSLKVDFPETVKMANGARKIVMEVCDFSDIDIIKDPDDLLLKWINTEFDLFKYLENDRYSKLIGKPFKSVDQFVETANTILNRRKSRAGKSLEHHLANVFDVFKLEYDNQAKTENNNRPDFIFPGQDEYQDSHFSEKKLIFLGAKTTCKDRWRQVLKEADRIERKHLFTLQQGISANQLKEMEKHKVSLVVPKKYVKEFPVEYRAKLVTLESFTSFVKYTQECG